MSKALIQALISSRYDTALELLLEGKFEKNAENEKGLTAIHIAASKGYCQLLKLMIKLGFDKNATTEDGRTPLHFAVEKMHVDATNYLLSLPVDVNVSDNSGSTPLHLAVEHNTSAGLEITRALLDAQADPNFPDKTSKTPLHLAVLANAYSQVRLLVQSEANRHRKDNLQCSPLDYATQKRLTRIKAFLMASYCDEDASDTDSEDITDYQFLDDNGINKTPKSSNPSLDKQPVLLSGNIGEQTLQFEEMWIVPNGDCAFIGLGTDRASLTNTLRQHPTEAIRELMWSEIADAILTKIYKPYGSNAILEKYFANSNANPNPLKTFCLQNRIFRGYLALLENPDNKVWLGYQTAKAYATLKNIQLYIWTKNDDETLTLADQNETAQANQEIHLLHTEGFTHFNLLVKKESFDDALDSIEKRIDALSLNEQKQAKNKPTISVDDFAIPHFRGMHFYQKYFTRKQRKQNIDVHRQQNAGKLPRIGLYSGATYEIADSDLELPKTVTEKSLNKLEAKLSQANTKVIQSLQHLQADKNVDACLGRGPSKHKTYSSRYTEFVQRYVNSYQTLMEDMKNASTIEIDDLTDKTLTTKWTTFKNLRFTKLPLVSTSEEVYWGLEYASALLNWDKFGTHQPRKLGISVLAPSYNADGHPRFPYLGILYVTLHSHAKLTDEISTRILDLFSDDEIVLKCGGPGGHLKSGYLKARERVFIGGIERDCVKLSLVVRVPSFYHEYRPFILDKYGITENEYNRFKDKLRAYGHLSSTGTMRNAVEFHNTEQNIIQCVINRQNDLIKKKITHIAEKQNIECRYLGLDASQTQLEPPLLNEFIEKNKVSKNNSKK